MFLYQVLLQQGQVQNFPQVSGAWDSSNQNLTVKIKVKKALRTQLSSMCLISRPPAPFLQQTHIFHDLFFMLNCLQTPFCGHSDPSSGPGELWLSQPCPCTPGQHLYTHPRSPAPAPMPHTPFMLELCQGLVCSPGFLPPLQGMEGPKEQCAWLTARFQSSSTLPFSA